MQVLEQVDFSLSHGQNPALPRREPSGLWYLDHTLLALWQVCKPDLLDGHSLSSAPVEGLVHRPEGALADAVSEALHVVRSASHVSERTKESSRSPSDPDPARRPRDRGCDLSPFAASPGPWPLPPCRWRGGRPGRPSCWAPCGPRCGPSDGSCGSSLFLFLLLCLVSGPAAGPYVVPSREDPTRIAGPWGVVEQHGGRTPPGAKSLPFLAPVQQAPGGLAGADSVRLSSQWGGRSVERGPRSRREALRRVGSSSVVGRARSRSGGSGTRRARLGRKKQWELGSMFHVSRTIAGFGAEWDS